MKVNDLFSLRKLNKEYKNAGQLKVNTNHQNIKISQILSLIKESYITLGLLSQGLKLLTILGRDNRNLYVLARFMCQSNLYTV